MNKQAEEWLFHLYPHLRNSVSYTTYRLQSAWAEIMGEFIAEKSYIGHFKNGVLCIYTDNSVLMREFFVNKKKILAQLQQILPKAGIKEVDFRIGRPRQEKPAPKEEKKREKELLPLPEALRTAVEASLAEVEPESLRQALTDLRLSHERLQYNRRAAGWTPCPQCGKLTDSKYGICAACEARTERRRFARLLTYLIAHGNAFYPEVYAHVPCTEREYERGREYLLRRTRDRIFMRIETPAEQDMYIRLLTRLPEDQITAEVKEHYLAKLPRREEE